MNIVKNVHITTELTPATSECPNSKMYSCYDGMATEVETLEFLYGLVRLLKPEVIVETGSYLGHGTVHLAQAAYDNMHGRVHSAEPFVGPAQAAYRRISEHGLTTVTAIYQITGLELIERMEHIDFAFLDSELTGRVKEAELVLPKLRPGGVIAIHDTCSYYTHNHPEGQGPRLDTIEFTKKHNLSLMLFNSPRGLAVMQRKAY